MTIRQKLLKKLYPLFIFFKKLSSKKQIMSDHKHSGIVSIYDFSVELNNGKTLSLEQLKGKKILFVNTASECGYTPQYAELQKLYQHAKEDLEIIAFPSNDFREQEKGDDNEIAAFCQRNYGVSFPLAKKSQVKKGAQQNAVFAWLTSAQLNGWNDKPPSWNFAKYLIDEKGKLTHYFEPAVSPLGEEMIRAVNN